MSGKIIATAPGKVILHGEYAVVFGKNAVAVSVDLRTKVEIETSLSHDKVTLNLKSFNHTVCWSLSELSSVLFPVAADAKGVIEQSPEINSLLDGLINRQPKVSNEISNATKAFLYLYLGLSQVYGSAKRVSLEATVSSEFPVGAGLGSSAAFSVSLTGALFKVNHLEVDLDLVSQWAFQCERLFHGKPSGIDNSICTFGGALLFREGQIQERLPSIPPLPAILVYTNVTRNTKALVESFTRRKEMFPEVMAGVMNAIDAISVSAWAGLTNGIDSQKYRMLVDMNQHLLNSLGAGHESIDRVVEWAKKSGLSAKLTGAGGGGCVIIHLNKG